MCKLEYDKVIQQAKQCMMHEKCSECPNNIQRGNCSLLSCILNKRYIFIDTNTLTILDTSELCDAIIEFGNAPPDISYINFIVDKINNTENLITKER